MKHRYLVTFVGDDGYFANMYFEGIYVLGEEDIKGLKYECMERSKENLTFEELVAINIYKFEESE